MIPYPIKFRADLKSIGTGWAIRNIQMYGNSVLPNDLFDDMKIETVEKLISTIIEEKVVIYHQNGGYIVERINKWK